MDDQRRKLCQAACMLVAGAALPACGSDGGTQPNPNDDLSFACGTGAIGIGSPSNYGLNTATRVALPGATLLVCVDSGGLFAMSALCTHQQTVVTQADPNNALAGFRCPLHGSTYAFDGTHPTAPAPLPLNHYAVCEQPATDGVGPNLIVDTGTIVDPSIRLKLT